MEQEFQLRVPEDVRAQVAVVTLGARALSGNGGEETFWLRVPEDVSAQVAVASLGVRALSSNGDDAEFQLRLPEDAHAAVTVVALGVRALSGNGGDAEFVLRVPEDVTAAVAVVQSMDLETAPGEQAAIGLDNQGIYRIVRAVAAGISGNALYEWADGSQFPLHGARVGLVGFSQARGELGQLLQIMRRRDPSLFAVAMGSNAEELLQVTTAASREERLQPVGNQHLWHEPWLVRFRQAAQQPTFQAAQNECAIEMQFRPLLEIARQQQVYSDRGLALLYERAVTLGSTEGAAWFAQRLLPAAGRSEEERLQALIAAAGSDRERLQQVYDSDLLDGTCYVL